MMAFYRLFTGLFLLSSAETFVNLVNDPLFPPATVFTNHEWNSFQVRTTIDNNKDTCLQFTDDDRWIKIWLGGDVNVATMTLQSMRPVSWKTAITIEAYNNSDSLVNSTQQNWKHLFPTEDSPLSTSLFLDITVNNTYRGFYIYIQSKNAKDVVLCEVMILGKDIHHSCEKMKTAIGNQSRCFITGYGNCSTRCPSKCKDQHCDAFDGKCIHGCQNSRMKAPDCNVCEGRFYGLDCSESCEHCKIGTFCDKVTGVCPNGCKENWNGTKCNVLSDSNNLSHDKGPSGVGYWIIGAIATPLVVAVFVIAALVYVIRKQRKRHSQQYVGQSETATNHNEMAETQDYEKLGVRQADDYMDMTTVNNKHFETVFQIT